MRFASTLVLTVALLGCPLLGCGGAETPASGPPAIANASGEDQACSRDSECVLVQDCCGCQRSGRQLAVHRDRVEALQESSTAECAQVSCVVADSAHRSCGASQARCLGGRCVPQID